MLSSVNKIHVKAVLFILVIILSGCSGNKKNNDSDFSRDQLVDSLKRTIVTQNDSIVKLTQVIDNQSDSILKLNGGVRADEYWENAVPKDSLPKK